MGNRARNRAKNNIKTNDLLEVTESENELIPAPKLIWTYFKYDASEHKEADKYKEMDSSQFTDADIIRDNYSNFNTYQEKYKKNLGCKEFWMKFQISKNIYFIDSFFNEFYMNRIFDEMEKVNNKKDYVSKNITIFAEWGNKEYSAISNLIKNKEKQLKATIEIFSSPHNIIHDRFALMDGEIWHCGAAIGGMHGRLSALSRGWKDTGNKMLMYIQQLQKEARWRQK